LLLLFTRCFRLLLPRRHITYTIVEAHKRLNHGVDSFITVPSYMSEFDYKQVIVMRSDLKMGKGKIAAQAGHAAVSAAEEARKHFPKWWKAWLDEGQCKIAVKVNGEAELLSLMDVARRAELPYTLISDRGLTQLEPGTITCLAIGPAPAAQVDEITGKLALL